ncbi:MAG TPA: cobalamin biosynthesis protein CbiG [Lachnospiraceae bacterium]|nr:cobalamin biosynthesis protein CbiG [Lachnospiraceae bacterium]
MTRVISFTKNGNNLNHILCEKMQFNGFSVLEDERLTKCRLKEWVAEGFEKKQCMVFVGAAGIAVRSIAPYIKDKLTDPAVIVIDEKGEFVIPILGGHVGGGNAIGKEISQAISAKAVITTATDVNNVFAVDVFAVRNNLIIKEREIAKKISAELLNGRKIGYYSDIEIKGNIPQNLAKMENADLGFNISIVKKNCFKETLHLVPKQVVLGIGCKKGTAEKDIEQAVFKAFEEYNIDILAVAEVATIDIKKNEKGLIDFCKKMNLKLRCFSAEELKKAEGCFTSSDFVKKTTGVDNVCERAAVFVCGGELIIKKTKGEGVTVAAALRSWSVDFE